MQNSIENIVFEDIDTPKDIAVKTVLLYAGSSQLKTEMKKLGVNYTKHQRGVKVVYILRGKFDKVEVVL